MFEYFWYRISKSEVCMRKVLIAVGVVVVLLVITWTLGYNAGVKDANFNQAAIAEVQRELADALETLRSASLATMSAYCAKSAILHKTPSGTFWTTCSISGELIDPTTYKTGGSDNKTILPIGMYARLENAQDLLQRGYELKEVDLSVFAWDSNPSSGSAAKITEVSSSVP
jgi:hypothetical protein